MTTQPAFLGVHNSARGQKWVSLDAKTQEHAERLTQISGLDATLANVAARLGARPETLDSFLDPKLRDLLPDPASLRDCPEAAARINKAIETQESIAIFADYDVDGATSAALLAEYLSFYNIKATVYVPDRLTEGYGPNTPAMENLADHHKLIICVDCGTLAHDPIAAARTKGTDVVVIDHHIGRETLPDAIVVNPNRQDTENDLGYLCAAGVVFLVLGELNKLRRDNGSTSNLIPDLMKPLDLVALATIADVAPLVGVNRAFVRTGLKVMASKQRPGLAALINATIPNQQLAPDHIGFTLAPRLNAGGRIGRSITATQLLISQDQTHAQELVAELEVQNQQRQNIEAQITEEAIAQIEAQTPLPHLAFAMGKDWHPGVLGIVAARVKSHFGKPAVVLGITDGLAQGSARSISKVDLGNAIACLVDEGLLIKGGGHKMAAGLTLSEAQINPAMTRLNTLLARQSAALTSTLTIDALLAPSAINLELLNQLDQLGPFGASASPPRFVLADLRLEYRKVLKERHLKMRFRNQAGASVEVMAFGAVGGKLDIPNTAKNTTTKNTAVHLVVSLSRNQWNGRESVSARLEDWAWAE